MEGVTVVFTENPEPSFISWLIKLVTRSFFTHCALVIPATMINLKKRIALGMEGHGLDQRPIKSFKKLNRVKAVFLLKKSTLEAIKRLLETEEEEGTIEYDFTGQFISIGVKEIVTRWSKYLWSKIRGSVRKINDMTKRVCSTMVGDDVLKASNFELMRGVPKLSVSAEVLFRLMLNDKSGEVSLIWYDDDVREKYRLAELND